MGSHSSAIRHLPRGGKYIAALIVSFFLALVFGSDKQAQSEFCPPDGWIIDAQRTDADYLGAFHPGGLVYVRELNTFLLVEMDENTPISENDSRLISFDVFHEPLGTSKVPFPRLDAANTAYYELARALYILDGDQILQPLPLKDFGSRFTRPQFYRPIDLRPLNLVEPQGIAFDPLHRTLFIIDTALQAIIKIQADRRGSFAVPLAIREHRVEYLYLEGSRFSGLRGLAFHPGNYHLYSLNPEDQSIVVFGRDGNVVTKCSIADIFFRDPQGLVVAPSGDSTDEKSTQSLFVADSGIGLDYILPGQIVELTLDGP